MSLVHDIIELINEVLQLDSSVTALDEDTALLGAIPEFDSMAVVTILTSLEEQYGIVIEDDEVDAELFESVGSLAQFVDHKVSV